MIYLKEYRNKAAGTKPAAFSLITIKREILVHVRIFTRKESKNMTQLDPIKPRFQFSRISEVLMQPQHTFAMLASENAGWRMPMLALTLSTTLAIVVSGFLKARAASMGEVTLPPDWQWWTPDMQNNYMQAQLSMQGPVFTYVIPLVGALLGLWLGWLVLGALLHFGSTMFGGRGSMQSALMITAWASLPFLVRDGLRIVYMLIAQHPIQSPGLSGFALNAAFISQLLSKIDLFYLWSILLLVIGFSVVDTMPRNKSISNVLIVSILLLLIQSGIGYLLSGVSGLAIQRPFF